ncbi:ABC transporter substrate-binding protein [Rhodococcus triatomae]|uniref:Iron complex transport system substrate-binding protein n=1 Tax=Rhodococcus triatomae TaxID=300028 RepID=A0A1G8NL12_9NOCA|nr:ABC transporter substrate-binding protein [Rhodococcus triatomae]QNG20030.1 ABC transporter substrate-binding protein [Rhodococcus triatomae]QNG24054.1 ABC transporter substrate-binding protein [Rhodococcus triatomae]SDI80894.1 iron complex transport system substrate-binding protein [Rhodococcus triatomae]
MTPHLRRGLVFVLAAIVTTAAACGTSTDSPEAHSPPTGDGAFPVTIGTGDGSVTIESRPESVVSLGPTATEMLYAVGAGDQVVAVDDRSDYPENAPRTALSGYTPNVEAVLGYEPDLVVTTEDSADLVSGLATARVPTLVLPAAQTLDDVYVQIEQVGAATGHVGDAAEVVAGMQTDIAEILDGLPDREVPLTYYHELDDTYFSVTDATFIGGIYSMLGLRSIAEGPDAYPQLSAEFILQADPDVIFLADGQCCGVTPETVAERAGWPELTAVREGRVFVLDEDVASRWGPRVVDLMREVGGIVAAIPAAAPAP